MIKFITIILLCFILLACVKNGRQDTEIYNNNFENGDVVNIKNAVISQYNGSKVLGQYNTDGFELQLNELPKHDLVEISFDLYIHDAWDGNKISPDGPDIWQMVVDNGIYVDATFSNAPCDNNVFCSPQSYPFNYPNNYNNPKTGAYQKNLPGVCNTANGSTEYKISKTIVHSGRSLQFKCLDKLVQFNSANPKCDESWSIDNISIKAITL